MGYKLLRYQFLLCLLLASLSFYSQTKNSFALKNIDFEYIGSSSKIGSISDQIKFTYDIAKAKPKETYKVDFFVNAKGVNDFKLKSISGDYKEVLSGKGKQVYWDAAKDGHMFYGDISFSAAISLDSKVDISGKKHLVKSLVFPGLGDYKIRNKKHYFLYGLFGYGAVGASFYFNQLASENYSSYQNSFVVKESNQFFNNAKKQNNAAAIFAGIAGLVWTIDVVRLLSHVKKTKSNLNSTNSKYYYDRSIEENVFLSEVKFIDSRSNCQKKYDSGIAAFNDREWKKALMKFREANVLNPDSIILNDINDKMVIINKEIDYENYISMGDDKIRQEKYSLAKDYFLKALEIFGSEFYAKEKIESIDKYLNFIAEGDDHLSKKNYSKAVDSYTNASYIFDSWNLTNKIESLMLESQYETAIKQGDFNFNLGKFKDALVWYESALRLKHSERYPKNKIEECNTKLIEEMTISIEQDVRYEIYNENGLKIELVFTIPPDLCRSPYSAVFVTYYYTGKIKDTYNTKYLNWSLDFKHCNGAGWYTFNHSARISGPEILNLCMTPNPDNQEVHPDNDIIKVSSFHLRENLKFKLKNSTIGSTNNMSTVKK